MEYEKLTREGETVSSASAVSRVLATRELQARRVVYLERMQINEECLRGQRPPRLSDDGEDGGNSPANHESRDDRTAQAELPALPINPPSQRRHGDKERCLDGRH